MPRLEREWPWRVRRSPRLVDGGYLLLGEIARTLKEARDRYLAPPVRILDIGCGEMPYYPLFAEAASEYVGADLEPGRGIRYVGPVEDLDVGDDRFDLVLLTQVLEHVRRPQRALATAAASLHEGGYAFVTTHGVYPFHPYPTDYWRWTQQGFEALVEDVPELELVELVPHRGTAACLALLMATYVEMAATRLRVPAAGWPIVAALNLAGIAGDRLSPRLRYPSPQTLIANFLLVLRRRAT